MTVTSTSGMAVSWVRCSQHVDRLAVVQRQELICHPVLYLAFAASYMLAIPEKPCVAPSTSITLNPTTTLS